MPRRTLIACLLSANACGPDTAAKSAGSDESGGVGSTSGTTITGPSATSEDSTAQGDTGSSTGTPPDPCSTATPPNCPDGCTEATVYNVDDPATCGVSWTTQCVSGEHVVAPALLHSYWRDDGFVIVGSTCGSYVALDDAWRECRSGDADPPGCACFCREGVCPGDEDHAAFVACEFDAPCPVSEVGATGLDAGDPACVLSALRDRSPGMLETRYLGFQFEHSLVHLDGSDSALLVHSTGDTSFVCPDDASLWMDAQRCTLAPPQVFDDCLAETNDELLGVCLVPSLTWFTSCRPTEPTCE